MKGFNFDDEIGSEVEGKVEMKKVEGTIHSYCDGYQVHEALRGQ